MNIIFFGSSEFAVESLRRLVDRHAVRLVVTPPDRPRGRHLRLGQTPVKEYSLSRGLEVFQPETVNSAAALSRLRSIPADLFIVISFGQILKPEVLAVPARCCLNVHASLLPRWRGAAPINWAFLSHDRKTGVSVIRMNEQMDAGDVLKTSAVAIRDDHDAVTLGRELAQAGAAVLEEVLTEMEQERHAYTAQDESAVTIARKLHKRDGCINWRDPAAHIYDQVRGLVPWPSAFTYRNGVLLKIHRAAPAQDVDIPAGCAAGTVLGCEKQRGIIVATGNGGLALSEVQPEGGRRMSAYDFVLGHALEPGDMLG